MVGERTCRGIGNKGERCRAQPLRESDFCVFHDPEHADAVSEGRRLGGLRRRREGTLAAAYDFDGLTTVQALRRVLEIATLDTPSPGKLRVEEQSPDLSRHDRGQAPGGG